MLKRRLSFRSNSFSADSRRGFSLVELIVVVAIFLTITSVILFNQNRFSSNSSIQNLAYQMALSIREAQVYGISVRGSSPNSNATFDTAFGIHFDCRNPTSYVLFADMDGNGIYDGANGGSSDQDDFSSKGDESDSGSMGGDDAVQLDLSGTGRESDAGISGGTEGDSDITPSGDPGVDIERSVFTLDSGNKISNIIAFGRKNYSCPDVESADITFKRPHPEAIIKDHLDGDQQDSQVEIDLISALKDLHQKIIVTSSGQIYVTN